MTPHLIQGISQPADAKWDMSTWRRTPNPFKRLTWTVRVQGRCVEVSQRGFTPLPCTKEVGDVIGPWSRESRMRLLRFLNQVDYSKIGPSLFVTLTYPDHLLRKDYHQRSIDRAVFMRYVEKNLGRRVPGIWRIEWEERKSGQYTGKLAPHFHLMLFGIPPQGKAWGRKWWRKTIRRGPGPLVTDARPIYNEDGACRYLSKYVSKYRPLDIAVYHNSGIKFGRHWGILREALIPLHPIEVERELTPDEVEWAAEFAKMRWPNYGKSYAGSYTLLSGDTAKIFTQALKKA